ncbi:MAG TPA: lactate racemase domain-containing protein [Roseiflexaceae bacterium]|nr:lactate racemase domain-containing protein [Roseiflexaceae bacterium]
MFTLPDHFRVTVAEPRPPAASSDTPVHVGGPALAELAGPGTRVVIAFTDATRACPDERLVGGLLRTLEEAGVAPGDITLLCATGLHRPSTPAERAAKLGAAIAARYRIVDHNALDLDGLVDLGEVDGLPVVVNRLCAEADLLLATGVVEPHQYAGYSGGAKTVVIGCGGEATIAATHGPAMLDRPGTRLGAVEGNPFQQFVRRAGERVGLAYVLNVLLGGAGEILATAGGPPAAVHDHLVALGRAVYEVPVERPAHLALAGVEGPKAANLYQASRAATYLALADATPLLPGAPILLPAAIPEGAGEGEGERRFFEILSAAESPATLIGELRRTGFPAGAQRAYVLAQVLARHPVIVVGAEQPDVVRACHMHAAEDMAEGLALAERLARDAFGLPVPAPLELLAVPHALLTLPRLKGPHPPSPSPAAAEEE